MWRFGIKNLERTDFLPVNHSDNLTPTLATLATPATPEFDTAWTPISFKTWSTVFFIFGWRRMNHHLKPSHRTSVAAQCSFQQSRDRLGYTRRSTEQRFCFWICPKDFHDDDKPKETSRSWKLGFMIAACWTTVELHYYIKASLFYDLFHFYYSFIPSSFFLLCNLCYWVTLWLL